MRRTATRDRGGAGGGTADGAGQPASEPRSGTPPPAPALRPQITPPRVHRAEALAVVRADLGECTRCKLHKGRTNLVFGVGNAEARLMFVGEGPGADEDEQGVPSSAAPGSC